MRLSLILVAAVCFPTAVAPAQQATPGTYQRDLPTASPSAPEGFAPPAPIEASPTPQVVPMDTPKKRGWFGRMVHPFSSSSAPRSKDPKLRGLTLSLQVSPQPVKLSEIRKLEVKVTMINQSKRAIELNFPTDQRIEIYLISSAGVVLTKWSDNHAITEKPATVLINPDEHIEYNETIATRELTPDKVFIAEVFFPKYPDLRVRQKFMTAP